MAKSYVPSNRYHHPAEFDCVYDRYLRVASANERRNAIARYVSHSEFPLVQGTKFAKLAPCVCAQAFTSPSSCLSALLLLLSPVRESATESEAMEIVLQFAKLTYLLSVLCSLRAESALLPWLETRSASLGKLEKQRFELTVILKFCYVILRTEIAFGEQSE